MSFNEKIESSISNISTKIESYNDHLNIDHRKCDYIELLALLNKDELYEDDLLSRFYSEYSDRNEEREELKASSNDAQEKDLQILFNILKYRQSMFGQNYPFIITNDSIQLKDTNSLTIENKFYVLLLCCANLKKFNRSVQYRLTEEFEEITFTSIKKFLPQFNLKRMGANADYVGNTKTKLKTLAEDLNIDTNDTQISNLAETASKEKGVDIFASKTFKDKIPNMLMLSIQCACGEDTSHKINEAENYHNYLHFRQFKIDPIIVLSVPKAISIGNKSIKDHLEVMKTNSLFFDRLRLMEYIDTSTSLETLKLVDQLIEKTISIVD